MTRIKNPKIDKLLTEFSFNAEKFNKINMIFLSLIFKNDRVQKLNNNDAKTKHLKNQSTIRIENDQNGFDEKNFNTNDSNSSNDEITEKNVNLDNIQKTNDQFNVSKSNETQSQIKTKSCKCSNIANSTMNRIKQRNLLLTEMNIDENLIITLRNIIRIKKKDFLFKHVCFSHLKTLNNHTGFQIKNLKSKNLKKRLQQC